MANKIKPTVETGAMTLVLLVKNYKSQMTALLLKNGVIVPNGASDEQVARLMANLLKVSKSFFNDLNSFLQNPKVIEVLTGGITQSGQYLRASGFAGKKNGNAQYFRASGYMNSTGGEDGFTDTGVAPPTTTTTATTTPPKTGFWSNLNFGNLFTQAVGAFGSYDKNKTDKAIAEARASLGTFAGSNVGSTDETQSNEAPPKEDTGMGTTTIVVISLVSVAVLGAIIYFVAKAKK